MPFGAAATSAGAVFGARVRARQVSLPWRYPFARQRPGPGVHRPAVARERGAEWQIGRDQ